MKVNFDLNNNIQNKRNRVGFEGFKPARNNYGEQIYEFNYPFDANKYDCYLEVCAVNTDNKNNYYVMSGLPCMTSDNGFLKLNPNGNKIDMSETFNLPEGADFAYHYALVQKGNDRTSPYTQPIYKIDAGDYIDSTSRGGHEIYNIVTGGAKTYSPGSMKLLMPDFYNPSWVYDKKGNIVANPDINKIKNSVKTFSNKLGGTLAGIEKDVRDGKFDGYSRIISTPLFTDDDVSAHGYWNKNCMQMIQSIGNINNYASLQREMFKKGLNMVSDGAYVNEGLEGIHFANVLKYGAKSPFYRWFNAENIKNGPFSLGVFSQNNSFIRHKLVNPKYIYTQDFQTGKIKASSNKDYNKNQPTYIQIFDDRLVSDNLKKDNKNLIKSYDILNSKNKLEINNHNDTIIPYAFEIDPEVYNDNITRLNEYNASAKKQTPKNITNAFDTAIDIVIPKTSANSRNADIKDIIDKAIADVEFSHNDEKYSDKVDLILKKANNEYGLKLNSDENEKLSKTLHNLRNTIQLDSYMGTRFVSKFENFELEEKIDSKIDTWNANTDIPKLKFLYSKADTARIKMGYDQQFQRDEIKKTIAANYEVQDYVLSAGKFWTKKTKDILNLYVAQQLTDIDSENPKRAFETIVNEISTYGTLPKKLRKEINPALIENVLNNDYDFEEKDIPYEYKDFLLQGIMELPLDSIEFGDNLVSVLASPYITKRATNASQLGLSRYEMFINNNPHLTPEYENLYKKMDQVYTKEMLDFSSEIIDNLNNIIPEEVKIYNGYNTTEYGKYVLPHLAEAITKFAVIKALAPDIKLQTKENGEIVYDYEALKKVNLQSLKIHAASPEDEAKQVINNIKTGISKISIEDKKILTTALLNTIKGTNVNSFRLAEVIVDRTNSGLDWRIDATKDIGDMNALRDQKENLDSVWSSLTDFWKNFADTIYKQNRNAYIVAEVTDEGELFNNTPTTKYSRPEEMVKKFLRETKMDSTANYSTYFSTILNMFGKHFDRNGTASDASHRIANESRGFFENMTYDGIINSYNFIGNHDKPRVLHGLVLNTDWFVDDWKAKDNRYYREKAIRILEGNFLDPLITQFPNENDEQYNRRIDAYITGYNLDSASGKALAMAESLQKGFEKSITNKFGYNPKVHQNVTAAVYNSISDLANGSYKDKNFDADGFGVKSIEDTVGFVINQAVSKYNLNLENRELISLKKETIKSILEPKLSALQAMTEVLSVMPGMPTLYAGDDLGATGYESGSKNMYLQNRGYTHNEWLETPGFEFIKDHYEKMNGIMAMRNRPELHALNDGAPFILDFQKGHSNSGDTDLSTILRQGTDGSIVISLINTTGINTNFEAGYHPETVFLNQISITNNDEYNPKKLTKGLTPGTVLYNAKNKNDKFIVREFNGNTFIKHLHNNDVNSNPNEDEPINIYDTTLTLYSKPTSKPSYHYIKPLSTPKVGERLSVYAE